MFLAPDNPIHVREYGRILQLHSTCTVLIILTLCSIVALMAFPPLPLVFRDVCAGMEYINSQGFVHRDIAARNVLLNSNGQAKVCSRGYTSVVKRQ